MITSKYMVIICRWYICPVDNKYIRILKIMISQKKIKRSCSNLLCYNVIETNKFCLEFDMQEVKI